MVLLHSLTVARVTHGPSNAAPGCPQSAGKRTPWMRCGNDANDPTRTSIVQARDGLGSFLGIKLSRRFAHSGYTMRTISRQRMGAPETESSVDSRPYEGVHHVQKHVQKTVPQGPGCLDTCARYRRHGSRTSHCARSGSSGRCCEAIGPY